MRNNDTVKKLGHKVRIVRTERALSQEALAEAADLNRSFIGLLERGKTNVTIKNLEAIANALDVDIKSLFEFTL